VWRRLATKSTGMGEPDALGAYDARGLRHE